MLEVALVAVAPAPLTIPCALTQAWDTVWLQSALVDVLADLSDDLCGLVTTFKVSVCVVVRSHCQTPAQLDLNTLCCCHTTRANTGGHVCGGAGAAGTCPQRPLSQAHQPTQVQAYWRPRRSRGVSERACEL